MSSFNATVFMHSNQYYVNQHHLTCFEHSTEMPIMLIIKFNYLPKSTILNLHETGNSNIQNVITSLTCQRSKISVDSNNSTLDTSKMKTANSNFRIAQNELPTSANHPLPL